MTDDFDALLNDGALEYDTNVQEVLVRRVLEARQMGAVAADSMLRKAAKVLGLAEERLTAICSLENMVDRRQALKVRGGRRMLPRLPDEDIYPHTGWLGGYLRWAEHMEVPLAWHFWAGLAVLAACCRRNFYTHSGAYPIWPSLYVVLVGPSGEGKSLCMQSAARPMIDAVNRKLQDSREAEIDDTINIVPDRVTVATFLDCASVGQTIVKVEKELDDDGKLKRVKPARYRRKDSATFLLKDELCAFIGRDSLDAGAWIEFLLDISNGNETYINPTQVKTRRLEGISLTCLFGSAEENLRRGMPPTFLQGGMMGRCMWVHRLSSGRTYPTMTPVDPVIREDLAQWLAMLTRQPAREVLRHPETDAWWEQFYQDWSLAKDTQPEFRSWHNRAKDQILRVAMLLALSNGRFVIRLVDLELAKTVMDAERERYSQLFSLLSLTKDGELNDLILRAVPYATWIIEDELAARMRPHIGGLTQLQKTLELLVAAGTIERADKVRHRNGRAVKLVTGYRRVAGRRG